jgi:hypothetical protein
MPERKTKIVVPPGNTPTEGFDVPVEESTERWSELILEDKSILRVKPVIAGVVRVSGQFDPDGNPLYVLRGSIMMTVVEVPENLKNPNSQ